MLHLLTEDLPGSDRPVQYLLAPTLDGLYTPYALRTPADEGVFPYVFVAYGNGGGGLEWLRDRSHRFRHVTDVLLAAGFACGWARYRTEVELGYHRGGPLVVERRQGMDLLNRAPLEFEDEVAVLRDVATHPQVDADRLGHVGVSHAGEMLFKLCSQYPGLLAAGVAVEPANHELLHLSTDDVAAPDPSTGLRDIESLQLQQLDDVLRRVDLPIARQRLSAVDIPVLVVGREGDELQGVFRATYELLAQQRPDAEWRSWRHDVHGYTFPEQGPDGVPVVDGVQREALGAIVDFLTRTLTRPERAAEPLPL